MPNTENVACLNCGDSQNVEENTGISSYVNKFVIYKNTYFHRIYMAGEKPSVSNCVVSKGLID